MWRLLTSDLSILDRGIHRNGPVLKPASLANLVGNEVVDRRSVLLPFNRFFIASGINLPTFRLVVELVETLRSVRSGSFIFDLGLRKILLFYHNDVTLIIVGRGAYARYGT